MFRCCLEGPFEEDFEPRQIMQQLHLCRSLQGVLCVDSDACDADGCNLRRLLCKALMGVSNRLRSALGPHGMIAFLHSDRRTCCDPRAEQPLNITAPAMHGCNDGQGCLPAGACRRAVDQDANVLCLSTSSGRARLLCNARGEQLQGEHSEGRLSGQGGHRAHCSSTATSLD